MFTDLTGRPVNPDAYSARPFTFLDQVQQNDLANMVAINLIENGDRTAREHWQNRQLTNLLKHAHARSAFWRSRMPSRMIGRGVLPQLPIQSRAELAAQVQKEGPLATVDGNAAMPSYSSSGSTGTPVKVYFCPENSYYNAIRSIAQNLFNGLSLQEPRVRIVPATRFDELQRGSMAVESANSWAGPLAKVFCNGPSRKITHRYDDDALVKELLKEEVGYLVCANRYIAMLLDKGGVDLIKKIGVKLWLHYSDYRDPEVVAALGSVNVPSLSNYSAGEIGPIAFECRKHQGYYHVAHSNVIVESDSRFTASFNGESVGRVLITNLHSYATPIIRYDVGDFAKVEPRCPCGHDGTVISNIFGRGKHFLRHPDGRLLPFYLSPRLLLNVVSCKECRIRQEQIDTITIEIGGRDHISPDEETRLKELVARAAGPAFNLKITPVAEIDWTANSKRLFFSSTVA
jgi:phenylacetate-coenzyme A ligase PaaK-like adenylate-forming protein